MDLKDDHLRDIKDYLLDQEDYIISKEEVINRAVLNIDELIAEVCEATDVKKEDIIKRTKIQRYADITKAIVLLSEIHVDITNTEFAFKLNIPPSMVSKIKRGVSKRNENVDKIIDIVENKVIIQA